MHFWVEIWSFCRGTEITNLTEKKHFWNLIKKLNQKTHYSMTYRGHFSRTRNSRSTCLQSKFCREKITILTPIFSLLTWITYSRWTLNPYKVYIFWKLHVLGIFCIGSYCSGVDTADVIFFSESKRWNVTKILKCVLDGMNSDDTC